MTLSSTSFTDQRSIRRRRRNRYLLIAAAVALAWWFIKPLDREWGPKIARGKAEPCFAGRLLLAPNGTVWLGDYQDTDGKLKVTYTSFLPGNNWTYLSGSETAGLAIKDDGSLWMWLTTPKGPKEAAEIKVFHPPARVGNDSNWAKGIYGLLLKTDGSLWRLERYVNDPYGELSGPIEDIKPVQIGSDSDWSDILSSQRALKRDGTVWFIGHDYHLEKATATKLTDYCGDWARMFRPHDFYAGPYAGLMHDGSLWVGGDGANTVAAEFARHDPARPWYDWGTLRAIGPDTDWVKVVCGVGNLVAQKRDGSWWATGNNHYSQLGFPHWFGHSKHLTRPKRMPIKLDVVAWKIDMYTTTLLTSRGNIYYLGRHPLGATNSGKFRSAVNDLARKIPRVPPIFPRPGEIWSEKPVKIGQLPREGRYGQR